jgi:hypothetical protein
MIPFDLLTSKRFKIPAYLISYPGFPRCREGNPGKRCTPVNNGVFFWKWALMEADYSGKKILMSRQIVTLRRGNQARATIEYHRKLAGQRPSDTHFGWIDDDDASGEIPRLALLRNPSMKRFTA